MAQEFITSKNKMDISEIALNHIKEILTISKKEFRAGYTNISESNGIKTETTIPDTRKEYIQAIESLSDILAPHYDKETIEFENKVLLDIDKLAEKTGNNEISEEDYVIEKFRLMRKMFRQLNFLLKKRDYLGGVTFVESEDTQEEQTGVIEE